MIKIISVNKPTEQIKRNSEVSLNLIYDIYSKYSSANNYVLGNIETKIAKAKEELSIQNAINKELKATYMDLKNKLHNLKLTSKSLCKTIINLLDSK